VLHLQGKLVERLRSRVSLADAVKAQGDVAHAA
jgi:hypothetical protein